MSEEKPSEPEVPAAKASEAQPAAGGEVVAPAPEPVLLRGTPVSPGLVLGVVHRKDYDLTRVPAERLALDEVERELNRFRRALDDSRRQLTDLKARLEGRVQAEDARILDTHLAYLKDSVLLADVENLIMNEQMRLEAAITKVIQDFDRIFRLVQSDGLRQTAVDLRDVGIRVLRNLESAATSGEKEDAPREYVLAARELSIVDMFNLSNEHVQGIVTEEGGLTSHAAIFARSMRIPTITGVEGLLQRVQEGDFVILDATDGVLRVNPDDLVRRQYAQAGREAEPTGEGPPEWAQLPARTRDGQLVHVTAMCGNLPEVEQAGALLMPGVGLYRTELLYLLEREQPSRETLVRHYASVVERAAPGPVTFRLLNVDSTLEVRYLHKEREPNPQLGRVGVRALLAREPVLRRQLQAILLATYGVETRIAVPFVTDCAELRRIKEVLFEERLELRKTRERFQDVVALGAVIETPASLFGMRDFAREADFLVVNLDALLQFVLAADRENAELAQLVENIHPFALRAIGKLCRVCEEAGRSLSFFGLSALSPQNLRLLIGVGARALAVPPSSLREVLADIGKLDSRAAARTARAAARAACLEETQSFLQDFRHGYAGS